MVRRIVGVIGLLMVALVGGVTAAAAAEIEVCENKNYGGRCVTLQHGVNDLRDWGMSNVISSFRIRSGTWRLCSERHLQGTCEDFSRSMADLAGTRLQDAVSSLRPVRSGYGGSSTAIVVYAAPNYRGRSLVFSEDAADLRQVGLNDRIASVRVLGGRWQICTDINYVGCRPVTKDIPDLGAVGWGNRVSSIREGDRWWRVSGDSSYGQRYDRAEVDRIIRRAYQDILKREPDPEGLQNYRHEMLDKGMTEDELRRTLRQSAEREELRTQQAEGVVRRAYQEILGREPDQQGLVQYRNKMVHDRWTERQVRDALMNSPEYRDRNRMTRQKAEDIVKRAYRSVLGREADPAGLRSYTDKVMREHWTEAQVSRALRDSDEYKNKRK